MKKAFSLIELLIVIVIIGVVYTLSIGNFNKIKENKKKISIANLKQFLQAKQYEKSSRLLCLKDCSTCKLMLDEEEVASIDGLLDESVKTYKYDSSFGMVEVEKEYGVCFSYSVDKKGVGKQVLVEFKNNVYDFSTYLGKTPIYSSLEDAKDARESLIREILQ